jgi:hypothetical protein
MKIKISESQAKRLKLIGEQSLHLNSDPTHFNPIEMLAMYVRRVDPVIVKIFNELSNLSVIDIATYEFDSISATVSGIEEKLRELDRHANDYIESQPEDDNWELEGKLTDASYEFNRKLDMFENFLYELKRLGEFLQESDIASKFPSLDITDIQ